MSRRRKKRIYFDICCLNRPYDDQRQERVRIETKAILWIIKGCETRKYHFVSSEAVIKEIMRARDIEQRRGPFSFMELAVDFVIFAQIIDRGMEIRTLGFSEFDAYHLASAELVGASIFLTTDDRLQKRAARLGDQIRVSVSNPVQWLKEVGDEPRH